MITSLVQAHSPTVRRSQGAHEDVPEKGRGVLPPYVDYPSPIRPTGHSHLVLCGLRQFYFLPSDDAHVSLLNIFIRFFSSGTGSFFEIRSINMEM